MGALTAAAAVAPPTYHRQLYRALVVPAQFVSSLLEIQDNSQVQMFRVLALEGLYFLVRKAHSLGSSQVVSHPLLLLLSVAVLLAALPVVAGVPAELQVSVAGQQY
jgi:hypothetical protein